MVRYQSRRFSGARLRAMTRIKIDGDTLIYVPEEGGEVDTTQGNIQLDMIRKAQVNRRKRAISASSSLAPAVQATRESKAKTAIRTAELFMAECKCDQHTSALQPPHSANRAGALSVHPTARHVKLIHRLGFLHKNRSQ